MKQLFRVDPLSDLTPIATSPERKLLAAVITRALQDALSTDKTSGRFEHQQSARDWLLEHSPNRPYSFVWAIDQLRINRNFATQVRRLISQNAVAYSKGQQDCLKINVAA